jgi:ribosomal protein S18 acetylase RimI-like enzyme
VIETRDRQLLEGILRRDPVWGGYGLGDLDDAQFPRTRWFLSCADGRALALLYELGHTTLITFGDPEPVPGLVRALPLPKEFHVHYPEIHAAGLDPLFEGVRQRYVRLAIRPTELRDVKRPERVRVAPLSAADVPAAHELYAHYPDNWFVAARVDEGCYVGGWDGEALVAVGGTHVVSNRTRVAALGDIVTTPTRRGEGLGSFLTHALCTELFTRVDLVVLNVRETNAAARRAYEKVGFGSAIRHREGTPVRLA